MYRYALNARLDDGWHIIYESDEEEAVLAYAFAHRDNPNIHEMETIDREEEPA